ncbi:MAG: cation-translocating P-type ATPase [Ferruginibacter sp.]|nr:cation-translocating P-type ATPase [Ferruginibacter sp.]
MNIPDQLKGLTLEEVIASQQKYGYNQVSSRERHVMLQLLLNFYKEPMLILLVVVCAFYFLVGEYGDALFMIVAIFAVSGISFYQDKRSKKSLEALEKLNEPLSTVIRNSRVLQIPTHEIAVGDLCIIEEGKFINADGRIVHSNDFSVDESALTGESFPIYKDRNSDNPYAYSGTLVNSGLAVIRVEQIGRNTRLGKIGESILSIKDEASPLSLQINHFVKLMALIGVIIFLAVWVYNYYETGKVLESLLRGLTIAMSILPEEIPVAFTTFMALGSFRLMKQGIIVKRSSIVETLGSTTVICSDKTGTITKNSMELEWLYDYKTDKNYRKPEFKDDSLSTLISYAMCASEPVPFDPMEKTLHQVYSTTQPMDLRNEFKMIHEYPLEGKPPMMTHFFENLKKERIIAAKGAPKAILEATDISDKERERIGLKIEAFGKKGYRVLGVAKSSFKGIDFPKNQQDLKFDFLGLLVFSDPPKEGIRDVFNQIYDAGIKVKLITGDNSDTTLSIAALAGIRNETAPVEGKELITLKQEQVIELSENTTLFTRMFPEAKLAVITALKKRGEIVAMLGDGINDGPALKAAHIGVAMGHKGTETAKASAALVLTNDDLRILLVGIEAGRRIYSNLKKAIQYIISIHIPIILTVSLPLFLGWAYPYMFTPVHVIFLELIMGPTCSIVYENDPGEKNSMMVPPRKHSENFLKLKELSLSIIQGLAITAGVLFMYQFAYMRGGDEEEIRSMVFSSLIFANIFLSYSNRSNYYGITESIKYRNNLLFWITLLALVLLLMILYFPPLSRLFQVMPLNFGMLGMTIVVGAASVFWIELYKWLKRRKA